MRRVNALFLVGWVNLEAVLQVDNSESEFLNLPEESLHFFASVVPCHSDWHGNWLWEKDNPLANKFSRQGVVSDSLTFSARQKSE